MDDSKQRSDNVIPTQADVAMWVKVSFDLEGYYLRDPQDIGQDMTAAFSDAKKGNARAKKYVAAFTMIKLLR